MDVKHCLPLIVSILSLFTFMYKHNIYSSIYVQKNFIFLRILSFIFLDYRRA